jgi:hypothetical protein
MQVELIRRSSSKLPLFPGCFAPSGWFAHFPVVFRSTGAFQEAGVQVTGDVFWPTSVSTPMGWLAYLGCFAPAACGICQCVPPRGVFRHAVCFVRRGVTSSRRAHSAGVKRPVGAFRADGDGVKHSGGVLCTDGVRRFTHQRGVTLLTPRGVPLSTPPSSPKHTRNRRVMLQEKFHRAGCQITKYAEVVVG